MKSKTFIISILTLLLTACVTLAADPDESRVWTAGNYSVEGKFLELNYNEKMVHIETTDGKRVKILLDKLSAEDQKYVKEISSRTINDEQNRVDTRGLSSITNQYVLLIGVNKYTSPIQSLRYCVNDMKLMADSFESIGYPKENIFLVTDDSAPEYRPTGENIRFWVQNVTNLMKDDDQLIIVFSGHGVMSDNTPYLCPSDSDINNIDSLIPRDWVFEELEKCKAKQKVFIIDAARDQIVIKNKKTITQAKEQEEALPTNKKKGLVDPIGANTHGFILIASCDKEQKSFESPQIEHGVFMYYLAEGLKGNAADDEGFISVLNLFVYANSKTSKYVRRELSSIQVPTLRQYGEMTDFYLAKLTPLDKESKTEPRQEISLPLREWKSISGKTIIKASLDISNASNPEMVYLVTDGRKFKIPFNNLSEEDRIYVNQVRKKNNLPIEEEEDFGLEEVYDTPSDKFIPRKDTYALLIGVDAYKSPIAPMKYCGKDAKLLAESFELIGVPQENIVLMTDDSEEKLFPTVENIRNKIRMVTQLMKPNDLLVISFSGHGVMIDDKVYLCPSDANLEDINSFIPRDWFFEQLEECRAKQKICILDLCHNNFLINKDKVTSQVKPLMDSLGNKTYGFILISSCDKDQKSWESSNLGDGHGAFTYFLADGLNGGARNEDGNVSIFNLFAYVNSKTSKYAHRQFNVLQVPTIRTDEDMPDFHLVKLPSPVLAPYSEIHQYLQDLLKERKSTENEEMEEEEIVEHHPQSILVEPSAEDPETPSDPDADSFARLNKPGKVAGEQRVAVVEEIPYSFRWCPPGEFKMGFSVNSKVNPDEKPSHNVKISKGFWMLETEVTQAMWYSLIGRKQSDQNKLAAANSNSGSGPLFPIYRVNYQECESFCKNLGKRLELEVQLPTEAQWEYACRAGTQSNFAGNGVLEPLAWYNKNSGSTAHEVAKRQPNQWGLYDMHGNVSEWCSDWYSAKYYAESPEVDPENTTQSNYRVIRGGSWISDEDFCRSSRRFMAKPEARMLNLGLRVIIVPSEEN